MTDNLSDNVTDFSFLQGVKVIDFTQFEAGPSCTEALAWLGADVVKVENPKMGDPGRRLRPGKPDNDPYYFHMFNANKKSITLNLKSPEGLELAKEMIAKADVMMENFAPGAIERLGLSYDVVKAINPGITYAQVKGFGEGSPFEKNLAFDMIAQACGVNGLREPLLDQVVDPVDLLEQGRQGRFQQGLRAQALAQGGAGLDQRGPPAQQALQGPVGLGRRHPAP